MEITLPWPPAKLSPNARTHWGEKSRVTKKYRMGCYVHALHQGVRPLRDEPEELELQILFLPPSKRRRDQDNLVASMKSGLDGLAQALGVDDHIFRPKVEGIGAPVPGGAVRIRLITSEAK